MAKVEPTSAFFRQALTRLKDDKLTKWVKPYHTTKIPDEDNGVTASIHDVVELKKDVGRLLKNLKANVLISECVPVYNATDHEILVPHPSMYDSMDNFYHSLFHELGHWTGRELHRLSLPAGRFNKHAWCAEELVAELTAVFLCNAFEVKGYGHAAYLDGYAQKVPEDVQKYAMKQAVKATKYILKHQ